MRTSVARLGRTPHLARARIAVPLARLGRAREGTARALRRALGTTLLGRVPPEERAWAARIEARRMELAADGGADAALMSLSPGWCVLLMRLVRELAPRSCLELGTGFGISTAYQAAALELNGSGTIATVEGSPERARLAEEGIAGLGLGAARSYVAPIREALPEALTRSGRIDFAFIDAEHEAEPTLAHFRTMLPALPDGAVIVLDDVDWSGVRRAHAEMARDDLVSTSLTVGRLGVSVIARPDPAGP